MKTHLVCGFALMLIATVAVATPADAQDGSGNGVKVHGRWTIDVRNPDGSLASHHEIENALVTGATGGSGLLAGLLGNVYTDLRWSMFLWGNPAPCGGPLLIDPCTLPEGSLTVTTPAALQSPYLAGTMRLAGSVTVAVDSTLFDVVSLWSASARGMTNRVHGGFTSKGVNIAVSAGQIVQVTVVFSFS